MHNRSVIVFTGGPGGGKTTILDELSRDPAWRGRFAALPEAISLIGRLGISTSEKLFQRVIVHLQLALEDALAQSLSPMDQRILLCHRGSLDPLAYWLDRGWPEQEFFEYTGTTRERHYHRYKAVVHLVTAADGAEHAYQRWPEAHRSETVEDAIRLDRLLQRVWSEHPHYYRIENVGCDWPAKVQKVSKILAELYGEIYLP
jgi:predicted ATPase